MIPISKAAVPRALFRTLADALDAHPVTREEAAAIHAAVEGLSPSAPLTLQMIESLRLEPGVEAALIFTWLRYKYPSIVNEQSRAANSASQVIRNLIASDDEDVVPEFATEFHRALTTPPVVARGTDLVALEAALARSSEDGCWLQFISDLNDKVVLELKPSANLGDAELQKFCLLSRICEGLLARVVLQARDTERFLRL